jgi:superfamily I DNA and/or RNA helicase
MLSVKKVLDLLKEGEKLSDICIITPYKAHAEKLKEIFLQHERYFRNEEGLRRFIEKNIYTIDSFQGREQRNIIINWVRSNYGLPGMPTKTGFLRDYRRVNVALSRARRKLILIGDYETLTKSDNQRVRHIFTQIKQIKTKEKIVL